MRGSGLKGVNGFKGSGPESQRSRRDERGELAQAVRLRAERRERAIRRLAQLRGELPRAVDAAERDEGRLAGVRAHGLSGRRRIAGHIEQVVDDLKHEAEVLR